MIYYVWIQYVAAHVDTTNKIVQLIQRYDGKSISFVQIFKQTQHLNLVNWMMIFIDTHPLSRQPDGIKSELHLKTFIFFLVSDKIFCFMYIFLGSFSYASSLVRAETVWLKLWIILLTTFFSLLFFLFFCSSSGRSRFGITTSREIGIDRVVSVFTNCKNESAKSIIVRLEINAFGICFILTIQNCFRFISITQLRKYSYVNWTITFHPIIDLIFFTSFKCTSVEYYSYSARTMWQYDWLKLHWTHKMNEITIVLPFLHILHKWKCSSSVCMWPIDEQNRIFNVSWWTIERNFEKKVYLFLGLFIVYDRNRAECT